MVFTELNGWERKIIHELAEEFGYHHETSQDKKNLIVKHKEERK